jgi:predicted nucleotidyltransferase
MAGIHSANIEMIIKAARLLGDLREKMAFLGGATTGLLITDPAAPEPRPTIDIDVIIEIISITEYYQLEAVLRSLGFKQSMEKGDPICRWMTGEITLDVMPTNEDILGFSNQWYSDALKNSMIYEIENNLSIKIVTAPYFLATKIEAFYGRGKSDFLFSHDMEDIISVIDGRKEIIEEVKNSQKELRIFLSDNFKAFLHNDSFIESLSGHLLPDAASQARLPILVQRIEKLT